MSKFQPADDFLSVFEAFCLATQLGEHTNSRHLFGRGITVANLKGGANIGVRTLERAMQQMSDEWPPAMARLWPRSVPRPEPKRRQEQTEMVAAR